MKVLSLGSAGSILLLPGVALLFSIALLPGFMLALSLLLLFGPLLRLLAMVLRCHSGRVSTALARFGLVTLLGALLRLLAMLVHRPAGLGRRHAGRMSTVLARFGPVTLLSPMLLRLPMLVHLLLRMPMLTRRRAGRCLSSAFRMAILFGLVRPHAVMSLAFAYRLAALAAPSARPMIPITGRVSFSNGS